VPKDYYKTLCFAVGGCLGICLLGGVFATLGKLMLFGNSIGFGMVLGLAFALGAMLDKKALKKGRQLDFKIMCFTVNKNLKKTQ